MGVVISTSTLSPFSVATGVIGLVSFAFTVGTFTKLVWTNLETMMEAPHEVHGYLTNLRQELLEERANLKLMRKMCRKQHRNRDRDRGNSNGNISNMELDDVSLKTMSDTIRHLIRRFEVIEKPFLEPGEEGIGEVTHRSGNNNNNTGNGNNKNNRRRRSRGDSPSPYYTHSAYAPAEKGYRNSDAYEQYEDDEPTEPFWAQRTKYRKYSLGRRFKWIWVKPEAQLLLESLTRVQVRRVARQVGGMAISNSRRGPSEMEEMVRRIDERMSRFVGVRRVGGSGEGGGGGGGGGGGSGDD